MTNILFPKIIYSLFLIFFGYFIILTAFYLFFAIIGFIEKKKREFEGESEDYPLLYFSTATSSISIIIPSRNEELWIRDALLSVVKQNYPKFEVIIVDDGSTDKTSAILNDFLDLKPVDIPYIKHYKDGGVQRILRSVKFPFVTVISKIAGAKKAGALNAGLNIAKNEYVCIMDADTVLEQNALLKVMAHVERDPQRIIGIGSYFGLSNGLVIKDGSIFKNSFSYKPIIAYQNLEYIRSFIGLRVGWSKFNSMPNIAGGFGLWRKDVLYDLGGFSSDFTCEDIELTFRAHDYIEKNKGKGYRILMLPYYVGWTEGPDNIGSLIMQRNRWQRVTNETVWKYKYMFFNPKYGAFGFLTLPYYLLYEVLGVFMEIASIALVTMGWLLHILDVKVFLAFFCLMILTQTFSSLVSVFAFVRGKRIFQFNYILYMMVLSFFEFFWYRWIISISKLSGMCSYARGIKAYDQYARAKRTK